MLKRISALCGIYIIMCTLAHAQSIQRHEHWIDNDVSKRTVVKSTADDLAISVDLKALSEGVHYFNFRAQDTGNVWGALNRLLFYIPSKQSAAPSLNSYEYWIDNDQTSRKSVKSSAEDVVVSYDITTLPEGVHYFNFRSCNSNGTYSSLERYLFFIPSRENPNAQLCSYEYWIDGDIASKKSVMGKDSEVFITYDITDLPTGVHYFNFRSCNSNSTYGALERYLFFIPSHENPNAQLSKYEFWLDNDIEQRTTVNSSSEEELLTIDLKDVANGVHFLNYRACNSNGAWGALQRFLFFKSDEVSASPSPIVAYEYRFGAKKENVDQTPTNVFEVSDLAIPIPSLAECSPIDNDCNFTFASDSVVMRRKTTIPFSMRFQNKNGKWGAPIIENIAMEDSIGHKPKSLGVQKSVEFDKMSIGDYCVFCMNIAETGSYYFKASQPCQIDLYNTNGTLYRTMNEAELLKIKQLGLFEGTYYGVVHNTRTDESYTAKTILVRLLLTEGYVPTPEIAFNDGKVSITCQQEGAKIYYTTDGKDPTKESAVYNAPFEVLTNLTIKAMATYEDLSPSDIATFKVNSYQAEQPVIEFANLKLYMTCKTPESHIYYTMDGSDPAMKGLFYTEPVPVSQNCTVKAVAKRDGYNNSDVTIYQLDVDNVSCVAPTFTLKDNLLTITTLTEGSTIYYTMDGTEPTAQSLVYKSPILLKHNCTIKAKVEKNGFISSNVTVYTVDWFQADMPKIEYQDGVVTITSSLSDAQIYYTIDGSEPTKASLLYTKPFVADKNCTVKAITVHSLFITSEVASYSIGNYKVATPVIAYSYPNLTITCTTESASVYYTTNGTDPLVNGKLYTEPITITNVSMIKAIALREEYNNSDVVTYDLVDCATPTFTLDGSYLTIKCETDDVTMHYTTDGLTPTVESSIYTSPLLLEQNQVITVMAIKDGLIHSAIGIYVVDWFQVEAPVFALEGHLLSITSETPNAEIYVTIGGATPDKSTVKYVSPIELTDNKTVKAIAYAEHFNDSEVTEFCPNVFACEDVQINYNGRYIAFETSTEDAKIYYTINGSTPSTASELYSMPIDINGLATVKAFAVKPDFNDGEISTFTADYYYDGTDVLSSKNGVLNKAFEWSGIENISSLNVIGNVNGDDIAFLSSIPSLKYLNIEEADVEDNILSANAFAGSEIVSISLPKTIERVGSSLFAGCQNLAAIQWNSSRALPSSAMSGFKNPNLLLYVKINSLAPSNVTNVITLDYAENIVLTDGDGNTNFYCPRPFTAKSISYRHNYSMKTQIGTCQGWETIALPFDVQTITHSKNGEIAPFAANNATAKPFWMYSLGDYGFEMADKIKANIPYIISMPNNEEYADEYILGGDVTFSAESVKVPVTEQKVLSKGEFLFIPTTVKVAQNSNVYVINKNEEYNGQLPGSMFVPDLRSVSPFEGYLALASEINRPAMVRLKDIGFDDDISGIVNLKKQSGLQIWGAAGSIHIRTDRERTVTVYSASGSLIRTVDLNVGENVINGIDSGVYIVEHTPVFVK